MPEPGLDLGFSLVPGFGFLGPEPGLDLGLVPGFGFLGPAPGFTLELVWVYSRVGLFTRAKCCTIKRCLVALGIPTWTDT